MGATHKETVTELVKAIVHTKHLRPTPGSKHPAADILRKAILLVEYGVRVYRDPETMKLVEDGFNKEKEFLKTKAATKLVNDLNTLKKKQTTTTKK